MSNIAISGASTGTATFTIESPATSTNRTLTLPDNTGTIITQNSTPAFASTIGVGGATAAASGAGITFPATQSASSDANTLDDYEEGTWTPTSPLATFSSAVGQYVKVGQMVTVSFRCVFNSITNSNQATITLPFTAVAATVGSSHYFSGCPTYQTTTTAVIVYGILENTTNLQMFNGGESGVTYTTFSSKQINGSITYRTST